MNCGAIVLKDKKERVNAMLELEKRLDITINFFDAINGEEYMSNF